MMSDDCPKCGSHMKRTNKLDTERLIYYCAKCKQKYHVFTAHKLPVINCPHCGKSLKFSKEAIDTLWMNKNLDFKVVKRRYNE